MKTLQQHINEKLVLNSNSKIRKQKYNYHPRNGNELKELVERLINERGDEADLNDIDVSEIKSMRQLFINCNNFNGDISEWDVSSVKDMFAILIYLYQTLKY